jgi:hypothetical protein
LHKGKGTSEKWHFGPVWDFGSSFNRDKNLYMYQGDVWHNHWIPQFCQFPAFMNRVKEIWNDFYNGDFKNIYTFIDNHEKQIKSAVTKDGQRWTQYKMSDFAGCIDETTERLRKNAAWLNEQWKGNNGNGGNGGNNDNGGSDTGGGALSSLDYMYVWRGGEYVEYAVADVDSITFAKKEGMMIKAKVPEFWGTDIYVYIWETKDVTTGEYKAIKQGDWYVYTYNGNELNIIFKKGKGWIGNEYQTEDLRATQSGCYIITQEGVNKATFTATSCGE